VSLPPIVLASASPRRSELLRQAGLDFVVEPSHVDEDLSASLEPEAAALLLAERKALAVAERRAGERVLVLGADTVVAVDSPSGPRLLGKPRDAAEARDMLRALSGSVHRVVTGVSVVDASSLGPGRSPRVHSALERTWVSMRTLSAAEIEAYVASGEWRDKAGGYAIQESADAFVTGLEEGGFDNVVGLPVGLALGLLARAADPSP
jgi:septum formation protein